MRRKLGSIKGRIVALVVIFTLVVTLVQVFFTLYQYQQDSRRRLLQSAEFNLNLVCGIISQDLETLARFQCSIGADSTIASYLESQVPPSGGAVSAFKILEEHVRNNRAYPYLARIIFVSANGDRLLQAGNGTTKGMPVTMYNIQRLGGMDATATGRWAGIIQDPFVDRTASPVLYHTGVITGAYSLEKTGMSYLMVSARLITGPLAEYKVPEGCGLSLLVGEDCFHIDGESFSPVSCPDSLSDTKDEMLNPKTRVVQFEDEAGERFVSVSCPVGDTQIWLTQTFRCSMLAGSVSFFSKQLFAICLAVILLGAATLLALNRMISKPISRLQERISIISGGDFTPDPSIEWRDELGDIGRGINHLARSVQKLMETRLADEKARRDLEYRMLQNQVNPHFLYNTLNSIKWMATIQNAPGIAEMTTSLARLLKAVSKGEHTLIPLKEEVAFLDDYFVIQKYRYGGSVTLMKEISLDTQQALLPRFTLQPLLENAIFHGIEPKGGVGTIRVTAGREGEDLLLTMVDDGVGMSTEMVEQLLSGADDGNSGLFRKIGLSNVHRRLQYEFGPDYGLSVQSQPGSYTRIIVRIPFVTETRKETLNHDKTDAG